MNNILDDDREEVAGFMTTLLPALNTTELKEAENTNNRPKQRRTKSIISKKSRDFNLVATAFISEVAAKYDEEKKNLTKN